MYKIIGSDGKEYGPISLEQLRQWISQGRASGETKVKAEDAADWQTLRTLPGLADIFNVPPPFMPSTTPPQTSGMAITSLVLGVLGLFTCGLTALFGLIFGILGLRKIKRSEGRLTGLGLAIAGIVVSGIMILMLPLFAAMLLPALAKAKAKAQSITCMNNARQITLGVMIHASSNTNLCPDATTWCDTILPEVGNQQIFLCKEGNENDRSHFAFNAKLSGVDLDQIKNPATTVMIFETRGGWNQSGGPELLLTNPRHNHKIVVGFADGHAEMVSDTQLARLNWQP